MLILKINVGMCVFLTNVAIGLLQHFEALLHFIGEFEHLCK